MIASSVYSWLKDIRSTFDAYEEEGAHNQSSSLLIRRTSCNHCKGNLMPLESKLFDDDGLQSNTIFTRGTPPRRSYQHCTSKQQFLRAKKAWSVGDSWGVNFQLTADVLVEESTPTTEGADSSVAMVSGDVHMKDKRCDSGSDSCKDNEELVLQEFAFLNDVVQELEAFERPSGDFSTFRNNAEEPIYMNISQIKNDKLKHQVNCSDTLSSTYSFVSLAPSELSTSDFSTITASSTSGTYTIDNFNTNTSTSSFSLSQGSVSSSNWKSEEWSDILKQTDYKCPDYETACRMDTKNKVIMRKSPLKKGKSLDSFNLTSVKPHQDQNNLEDDNDGVQLRRKTNRQSVIPVINPQESNRKAIIIPKESNYMHIWECRSKVGKRPVPTPRKNVTAAKLKIQHGRENVVSFAFDETVEFLAPEPPAPSPPIEDHTKDLPSMDVIMWLYELAKQCEYEPDLEIPNSFETTSIPDGGASSSRPFLDPLEAHPAGRSISHPNKSSHTDNIFDFNALKKYKIDNQIVKLSKNDVIEIEDGKLLHKNNGEVKKVLAKTMNSCRVEQKSPKEQVLNFPDDVKIHIFRDSTTKMDNNNVKNRLMQFFKKRPVVETLRTKGIYHNETVFGNTLSQLEQKNGTSIPALVRTCIELVELPKNIITEGLYRSSASMATLQDIRFAINENESAYLDILEKYTTAPDVPSGLLKLFIRELKESLVPEESFDILYNIYRNTSSPTAKYNDVVKCIEAMASAHRDTLDIILRHLIKISEYERQNGMSIDSIAICWGQTMCPLNLNNLTDLLAAKRKNEVVLLLLQAYQHKMADDTCSDLHSKKMVEDMCHIKRVVEKKISGTSRSLQNLHSPTDGANAANVMHELKIRLERPQKSMHNLSTSPTLHKKLSHSKSIETLNEMGSTSNLSVCSLEHSQPSKQLLFINKLILLIEKKAHRGVYRGKGDKKLIRKIITKSKKLQSKELDKLMHKADVFTLGDILKEIIKEYHFVLEFREMQLLIENEDLQRMRTVLDKIPEPIVSLFMHFKQLLADPYASTVLQDIFECWWPILIAEPRKSYTKQATEIVGKNAETFRNLMTVIVTHHSRFSLSKFKSSSMINLSKDDKEYRKEPLCCTTSTNRSTTCYSQKN